MTTKRIVWSQDNGICSVINPCGVGSEINPTTGQYYTLEEIALKDVPTGKKFKYIEKSDLPANKNFRDAWVVDEADLTDGVGA